MAPNLEFRLTGGSTNSDPSLSLGDITSNNTPTKLTLNNLFYDSTPDETSDGTGDYVCLDVINNGSGLSPARDIQIYTTEHKIYSSVKIAIGLLNSPMTRNRKTPPSSLLFDEYLFDSPLSIPDMESGDVVRAGEAIAMAGNTGELTTGPHLHFELYHKGKPINPEEYIIFN